MLNAPIDAAVSADAVELLLLLLVQIRMLLLMLLIHSLSAAAATVMCCIQSPHFLLQNEYH